MQKRVREPPDGARFVNGTPYGSCSPSLALVGSSRASLGRGAHLKLVHAGATLQQPLSSGARDRTVSTIPRHDTKRAWSTLAVVARVKR